MEKYIMALDQGTTSSRCIIFNQKGQIISAAQKEFEQLYPENGWVEHRPWDIWYSQKEVIEKALRVFGGRADEIAALGITNQRETTIVWDKRTGQPVYNAIVWQCRRTADRIEELKKEKFDEVILKRTGLIADAYFSAAKLEWILEHVPGARQDAEAGHLLFGTVDTWLMWNLSKGKIHKTDVTNASRTMLYDIHNCCWDDEILKKFNIPVNMLPEVHASSENYGYLDESLLGTAIPITGVAGDQQAALFGQCCFEAGDAKNTYGTGCFLLMHTGGQAVASANGLLTTMAASIDSRPQYALEGSVFIAGAAIQWLRDELRLIQNADETERYAEAVEDTNGMYIVPAFTGLGAPYWDQYVRGAVFGLSRGIKKEHFVRATLESLAYQTYDVVKAMERDSDILIKSLRVDGGACKNNFLMQFQADILETDVIRPGVIESTALGAAYLAGLYIGYWSDVEDITRNRVIDRQFHKKLAHSDVQKKLEEWHTAVACTKHWTI